MINSSILQLIEYIARENTTNNAQLVRYVAGKDSVTSTITVERLKETPANIFFLFHTHN